MYLFIYIFLATEQHFPAWACAVPASLPETDKKAFQWFWEEFVGVFPDLS